MFHKHNWETINSNYNYPDRTTVSVKGTDSETLMKVIYGFTVVTQRCDSCGEQRAYTVSGRAEE